MTDSAKDAVLGRIRTALRDRPTPAPVVRDYRPASGAGDIDVFVERVADYKATVSRVRATGSPEVSDAAVAETILAALTERGILRIVVPDGFPTGWLPAGVEAVTGVDPVRDPASIATLDEVGAVLTTCAVAITETGTIVLDAGPGMGPRALTLVPDYHLVVVPADQVVAGVPDAIAALAPVAGDSARPLTWISGPSATSDIELNRVEGVHGPRTLDVLVVE